jgi:hypothetical protein
MTPYLPTLLLAMTIALSAASAVANNRRQRAIRNLP